MTKPAKEHRSGRHCVHLMHAHLVFTPKWRREVFTGAQLETLKNVFSGVCKDFEAELTEFDRETDHVHLLAQFPPQVSVSKLINSFKGVSSRRSKVLHPEVRKHYWVQHFGAAVILRALWVVRHLKSSNNTSSNKPLLRELFKELKLVPYIQRPEGRWFTALTC